jgi:membrane-associated phospholipid phosphatase
MEKKIVLIICLISYLIIVFITEIFYREPLYKISVEYIENIKQEGFPFYFNLFWSQIFFYGLMFIGTLIALLCYPINIFFCNISIQITLIFIMCLLKSLYSSARPFWDIYLQKDKEETLPNPTECDGEFGNPSGHALISSYLLILWYLFINSKFYNKIEGIKKTVIKYITLVLSIICIFCIIYSRINRQIHSFNQILFGVLLGIAVFFTFCYILEFDKISPKDFITNLDNYKFILIPLMIVLFILSVILGFVRHNSKEEEYALILDKYCGYVKDQIFGKNTAFHSALIFIVIGNYIGLLFLKYKINKNYNDQADIFYNWNKGSKLNTLKIALFCSILPSILPTIIMFIPFKLNYLKFVTSIVLYFIFGFCNLGLCFYYGCILFNDKKIDLMIVNEEGIDKA